MNSTGVSLVRMGPQISVASCRVGVLFYSMGFVKVFQTTADFKRYQVKLEDGKRAKLTTMLRNDW